ncbi:tRNA pseudouridine(38-40) synthase TruA [Methanococcoides orientis]|uniref:tRNA pseudouridine(38-40) synthase TruA n=1 Tax=Methanococcoides orientis TaxID=2822137 RepID=UPI001E48E8F5|nr:tRNA pseudouridine(38-40) synthase TruA [Methanococcoides orientis]UGV40322.1 tRNA pseudouridine(38-40) synthase TruA [Methanococcoides orientis]
MRVALKIAYIGSNYKGSQVQPQAPTIEGELFKVLKELEIIKDPKSANFISSGRTDAGVHAMGQIIAFDTDVPNLAIPRVINSKLPGTIWAWAHSLVPDNFDPRRHAVSRSYRYIMCGEQYDISKIRSASKLLIGSHDFANFCTTAPGRTTVRKVERIDVRVSGNLTRIDVEANSFLWNMIRKIVTALMMVGSGVRDEEWLEQMLDPDSYEEGLEPAHAYGLVFMDVHYPIAIDWMEDGYAIRRAHERVHDHLVRYRVMADVLEHLLPIIPPSDEL